MTPLLQVRDLQKHYGKVHAVRGVSFELKRGECFGLLGPNGAGKTTTLEMIEGITSPSSGTILLDGRPLTRDELARIGIQFQETSLPEALSVRETLQLFSSFYKNPAKLEDLIKFCDLGGYLDQGSKKISGGQRQRLLIALALINQPDLIFLDEPTTGLDPGSRRGVWELVRKLREAGKTLVLTTHYMEEAAQLCGRIAIMREGQIIAQGTPQDLLDSHFALRVVRLPTQDITPSARERLLGWIDLGTDSELPTDSLDAALRTLLDCNVSLSRAQVRSPTLEDLFLKLTAKH